MGSQFQCHHQCRYLDLTADKLGLCLFLALESLTSDMLVGVLFGLVQDLQCDGEEGRTYIMWNGLSLLELAMRSALNEWAHSCCRIRGTTGPLFSL